MSDDSQQEAFPRSEYLNERNRIEEGRLRAADRYDRTILFIATGAIVLSMAFTQQLVIKDQKLSCPSLLLIGWIFLGLAILLSLISHLTSQRSWERNRNLWDARYKRLNLESQINDLKDGNPNCKEAITQTNTIHKQMNLEKEESNVYERWLDLLNIASLVSVVVGVVLIAVFLYQQLIG